MESYATNTCSLIVKVWVEEVDAESGHPLWRGHVTHVLNGQQHYFDDLSTLILLMDHYFQEIGITVALPASPRADPTICS